MSSILPQIKTLEGISFLHLNYAESLLKLMIEYLLKQKEISIGVYSQSKEVGSVIGFDSDDSEDVHLELRYSKSQDFIIVLTDNSEDINTSNFQYKFNEHQYLYNLIPEQFREWMIEVAYSQESKSFSVKKQLKK